MLKYLLVQPKLPHISKEKDTGKYFSYQFLKLAGLYRSQGHEVAMVSDDRPVDEPGLFTRNKIPFVPDVLCFSTVFSYFFEHVKACIEKYMSVFPGARVQIGGPHISMDPKPYRRAFPSAEIIQGYVEAAEELEPAWDLLPAKLARTQIIQFSRGCQRKCGYFCYGHLQGYKVFSWDQIAPRIRGFSDRSITSR